MSVLIVAEQEQSGRAGGLYVTVSRQRLDYGRPGLQLGANGNSPPLWTRARIRGLGQFRAMARIVATPGPRTARPERDVQPVRPFAPPSIERPDTSHEDLQLSVMLASIADEVQARTVLLCAAIAADFAGRIKLARWTLPRDHVAAAVAALKQAKREAMKFVRENAASEIKERHKQATRRGRSMGTLSIHTSHLSHL